MSNEAEKQWAPCIHSKEEIENATPWLKKVLETDSLVEKDPDPTEDSVLERILWILGADAFNFRDVRFRFGADQWVCVQAEVTHHDGTTEHLRTDGDTFLLAMAKTLERLKALSAAKEHKSGPSA